MILETMLGLVGTAILGSVAQARKRQNHLAKDVAKHDTALAILGAQVLDFKRETRTRFDAIEANASKRHDETREDLREVARDVRSLRDAIAAAPRASRA